MDTRAAELLSTVARKIVIRETLDSLIHANEKRLSLNTLQGFIWKACLLCSALRLMVKL
jgi:hypothetical protein